jgi:hypothetical protein
VPLPLQTFVPVQLSGSDTPMLRLVQVPAVPERLHAWQTPQEVVPQQTPSTQ